MSVVLRTSAIPPLVLVGDVRSVIQTNAEPLSIGRIRPMETLVTRSIAGDRVLALVLLVAAGTAVFLGAVGVYGVVAQIVRRREREIGIRTALGAAPVELLRLLLIEAIVFVFAGAATGLLGILAVARVLRSFLFQTSATDPTTLAAVSVLLITIAVLAALLPARRALGSAPLVSLRGE
jgi:putative ABC transport system permease protein